MHGQFTAAVNVSSDFKIKKKKKKKSILKKHFYVKNKI
jgi:hypothetical protein